MSKLVSLPLNRLDTPVERPSGVEQTDIAENVAGPKDYAIIVEVISAVASRMGVLGVTTGIPMLIALDNDAGALVKRSQDHRPNSYTSERRRACKEVVIRGWLSFARQWDATACENVITQVSTELTMVRVCPECSYRFSPPQVAQTLPEPNMIHHGGLGAILPGLFAPDELANFAHLAPVGESTQSLRPIVDARTALSALSESETLQAAMQADRTEVIAKLQRPWSVAGALQDCELGNNLSVACRKTDSALD
jgi:hypothetical protein